jgi:predicted O-linked N-acetylglucosamine transferase (SPINDLY family)
MISSRQKSDEGTFDSERLLALLEQTPDEPDLLYQMAMVLLDQHDYSAAEGYLRRLVRLQPDSKVGKLLLGVTCVELGFYQEAIDTLSSILSVSPDPAALHHQIGRCFAALHRYAEAFAEYQQALKYTPDHVDVLCSLGLLFTDINQVTKARDCFLQALGVKPDDLGIINNLGRIYKRTGQADLSLEWFERGVQLQPDHPDAVSNYLNSLNYIEGLSPSFVAAQYKQYAPQAFVPRTIWQRPKPQRHDLPIRIGYISADLYSHSVAFFIEPILLHHDRKRFEIFCYANQTANDETTEHLRQLSDGWRVVHGISDLQVAQQIADDRIDILVDLAGHTAGHRLGVCVCRPAPLQISWIGHPNTTGLQQIDYYLTDGQCDPPGMTDHLYSEMLYRLPRVFSCYLPPVEFPPVASSPFETVNRITLGCFNTIAKVSQQLIVWWSEILKRIENAVLYLKSPPLWDSLAKEEILKRFAVQGISPERLIIHGETTTRYDHLASYASVDIALDTFPYNGTTTTCEALWMGVPVVSLAGTTHVSRVGASFLRAVGLDDLVKESPEAYIDAVVKLAADRQRLGRLRKNLRQMMAQSALMDAKGVTREVEQAFLQMYEQAYPNKV